MHFEIAGMIGRCYARVVVGVLLMMAATAVSAKAQNAAPSSAGFQIGDRIALTVDQPVQVKDTLVVREGLIVEMPAVLGTGDISLKGVHRVDIQRYLTDKIGQSIKNPVVHARPFIRLGVSGSVMRPGFYDVPTDVILSDMVSQAGGPAQTADLNKTMVQRGDKVFLSAKQTSGSLRETVEQLGLMSGDQIVVGERSHHDVQTYVQIGGILLGAVGLVLTLVHH